MEFGHLVSHGNVDACYRLIDIAVKRKWGLFGNPSISDITNFDACYRHRIIIKLLYL